MQTHTFKHIHTNKNRNLSYYFFTLLLEGDAKWFLISKSGTAAVLVVVGSTRRRKKPLHKKRENMTETKLIYLSFLQNLSIRRHRRRKATAQRRFRRRCYNKARLQFSGRPETISVLSQSIGRVRSQSRKRNFYWFHFFRIFVFSKLEVVVEKNRDEDDRDKLT